MEWSALRQWGLTLGHMAARPGGNPISRLTDALLNLEAFVYDTIERATRGRRDDDAFVDDPLLLEERDEPTRRLA